MFIFVSVMVDEQLRPVFSFVVSHELTGVKQLTVVKQLSPKAERLVEQRLVIQPINRENALKFIKNLFCHAT